MTKKDYIKFANMIAECKARIYDESSSQVYNDGYSMAVHDMKKLMIELFQSDNPAFDSDRFNDYIAKRVQNLCK